jgi:acyl-coenzyme A synthetase/AMP-(fatty) acid ligase
MFETDISKYYRKEPIKKFNLNQTMYSLIKNESFGKEKLYATGFMGCNMTYGKLFESADKLAAALYNEGLREGKTVSILTINMPVVQECLLALSKIGCTASWIDLRAKGKDLIKYINSTESEYLIAFENMVPIINEIINETNVKKVIVCSPKDYLNPIIKVLANLKDKKDGKEIVRRKKFDRILQGGFLLTGILIRWCYLIFFYLPGLK